MVQQPDFIIDETMHLFRQINKIYLYISICFFLTNCFGTCDASNEESNLLVTQVFINWQNYRISSSSIDPNGMAIDNIRQPDIFGKEIDRKINKSMLTPVWEYLDGIPGDKKKEPIRQDVRNAALLNGARSIEKENPAFYIDALDTVKKIRSECSILDTDDQKKSCITEKLFKDPKVIALARQYSVAHLLTYPKKKRRF